MFPSAFDHPIPAVPSPVLRATRTTYIAVLLGALTWCSALVAAPVCSAGAVDLSGLSRILYTFFHGICHQLPERSIILLGWPIAVCVRCSAIYGGFLAGTILYPAIRPVDHPGQPHRTLLILAAVPLCVDGLSLGFLVYDVSNVTRAATGALFGLVVPFFVIPAAQQAVIELLRRPKAVRTHQQKGLSDA
jgi:uncharacterized membrane protein